MNERPSQLRMSYVWAQMNYLTNLGLGIILARLTFIVTGPPDRSFCKWNGSSWNFQQNPENGPEGLA